MPTTKALSRFCFLVGMLLAALPALCEKPSPAATDDPLPNAPPVYLSDPGQIAESKWFGVIDPGEKIPPLYARDKMVFWLHEEFGPLSLLPAFTSSGWEQLVDGDPKYGSDSGAYAERFGAAVAREASMRFFADSLLPTLTMKIHAIFAEHAEESWRAASTRQSACSCASETTDREASTTRTPWAGPQLQR